jgi:outer membrane lipoprotein-sorting protein
MRKLLGVWCVAGLLAGGAVRADDAADVKAVLDKAIAAHGGADNLTKYKAVSMHVKGKLHGVIGDSVDVMGDISSQLPDRLRFEMAVSVMGMDFKITQVVNGDKGWVALNDKVMEMTKEQMAEAKEQMHVGAVTRLVALRDKAYKLSPLGDAKVEGKDAVGVRVEHKDRRDVSLFFDKKTGLLLKTETRGKDPMAGDKEFTAETLYDDYKKVDGLPVAHKVTVKRDGKPFLDSESSDVKVSEKLDDSTFEKPAGS